MNIFKSVLLGVALALGISFCSPAQSIYFKPSSTYVLATNLASFAKASTNTATASNITLTNTYLSSLVPLPADRDLAVFATLTPAGAFAGTSNLVVGYNLSDGLTYTSTTDPVTVTFNFNQGSVVSAYARIIKTNFYGAVFLIPDYVANQSLTNASLALSYGFIYP